MNRRRATAAASNKDYDTLRSIAKEPGGFVDDETRRIVWPVLLHAAQQQQPQQHQQDVHPTSSAPKEAELHVDAHQVQLDVNRSFNMAGWHTQDPSPEQLQALRSRLTDITNAIFSQHPALRYYQGLHDILSVFVLVFQVEGQNHQDVAQACATQLCLHHLRDHLTSTLNPSIGYLRLLSNLLAQADPKLFMLVEEESNLPFFALSWVITWMSHDIESLPAIKRLFDLLLVMNPAFIVYVAAALTILQSRTLNMKSIELGELQHFLGQLPRMRLSTRSPASSNSDSDLDIPSDMSASFATSASSASHPAQLPSTRDPSSDPSPMTPEPNASTITATAPTAPPIVDFEEVLSRAQELWSRYPPQSIGLSDIFGHDSATRTWSLSLRVLLDAEAEHIVKQSQDIVKPDTADKKDKTSRHTGRNISKRPFWKAPQTIVLASAVAGLLLAIYGPRWLESSSRGKMARSWLNTLLDRFKGSSSSSSSRHLADTRWSSWFFDRLWR